MYAYFQKQPRADADCMLFEFCPHGDLYDFQSLMWKKNKGIFSEACMWSIYRQLTWAIAFLHEGVGCSDPRDADIWRPIVHRDVKLENVLITDLGGKDDYSSIRIKLGDFGLSAFYDPKNTRMPGQWGTSVLWPPEQTWVGREATPAGDVWAVGCIIHEMAHNFPPVADPKLHEQHFTALADAADAGRLPSSWSNSKKQSFWAATTLRQPLPINLEPNQHVYDKRRNRPTPKYSDKLNMCLQMALAMDREMRPTAGVLKQRVEEQEAAFHWEELIKENNAIMEDMVEEASVADWFE
jgi:serine/threonine protein kinase